MKWCYGLMGNMYIMMKMMDHTASHENEVVPMKQHWQGTKVALSIASKKLCANQTTGRKWVKPQATFSKPVRAHRVH